MIGWIFLFDLCLSVASQGQDRAKRGQFVLVETKEDRIGRQENEKTQHFGDLAKTHNFEDFKQGQKPRFKDVLAVLPSEEVKWYRNLTKKQRKEIRKRLRTIYSGDMEKMVEAAKAGDLKEVLAKQFKQTRLGAVMVGVFGMPPVPVFPGYTGGGCFSSDSQVETARGSIPISRLLLGDQVLTLNPGSGASYTEFLGWLDRSGSSQSEFLKVTTSTTTKNNSLTLSANHIIFRLSDSGMLKPVYARELQEGDQLVRVTGGKMDKEKVLSIERRVELGHWAPLTREGTLLVDGFLVSCFASFPHHLAQIAFATVKMWSRVLLDDEASQHEDGVRNIVRAIKKVGEMAGLRRQEEDRKTELLISKPSLPDDRIIAQNIAVRTLSSDL